VKGERHPTQEALLLGAIRTIEEVLAHELQTTWARSSALGLVGQLRYALTRSASNSLAEQDAEIDACLRELEAQFPDLRELLGAVELRNDPSWDLREKAARLLVYALDNEAPAAAAIRERLRPILTTHADRDLVETGPMFQAFLASGSLGSTG
jgi:hypothetical protein